MSPARPPAPRPQPPASRPGTSRSRASASTDRVAPRREAGPASEAAAPARPEPPVAPAAPRRASAAGDAGAPASIPPVRYVSSSAVTPRAPRAGGTGSQAVVSTRSVARFAERARARRNLARRQLALVAGGALGVVGLGYVLFFSPVLALDPQQVHVAGAGTVVAVDQVQAVVAAHAGTPLPRLDTVGLRDALLDVPGVRGARVMRDWPRGIAVTIVAREPVAAVPEASGSGLALLDEDGVQVGRVDQAPAGLPVVDVPVGDRRTLDAVLSVLHGLPADLLAQVQGVSAHTQDTVTMHLRDGLEVDWGSEAQTPLKVAVLATLRGSPASQGAHAIDVSAPTLPIVR